MRPRLIPTSIGIVPQWPLVVTATMLQFPSNWDAIAGGTEEMIAKAVDKAKAYVRLASIGVLISRVGLEAAAI